MGIETFIRDNILSPRLKKAECLVVYDPKQRYRDLCLYQVGLNAPKIMLDLFGDVLCPNASVSRPT